MLGLSLSKLLLTAAVVFGVWRLFRYLAERGAQVSGRARAADSQQSAPRKASPKQVEDLVACPTCGTYISAAAPRACGRSDCPY